MRVDSYQQHSVYIFCSYDSSRLKFLEHGACLIRELSEEFIVQEKEKTSTKTKIKFIFHSQLSSQNKL